jgi:hypothetical protein
MNPEGLYQFRIAGSKVKRFAAFVTFRASVANRERPIQSGSSGSSIISDTAPGSITTWKR